MQNKYVHLIIPQLKIGVCHFWLALSMLRISQRVYLFSAKQEWDCELSRYLFLYRIQHILFSWDSSSISAALFCSNIFFLLIFPVPFITRKASTRLCQDISQSYSGSEIEREKEKRRKNTKVDGNTLSLYQVSVVRFFARLIGEIFSKFKWQFCDREWERASERDRERQKVLRIIGIMFNVFI